jgi:tetratricopeptide (TPR) repeat protein
MPEDAVAVARDELAEAEAVFGPDHPYTTKVRTKLAKTLGEAGLSEEELPVRKRILAELMERNGAQDSDTAVAAHNYGFCLYECKRGEEGIAYIERAIRDIAPFVKPDGPSLFRLRRNLAAVLKSVGRVGEAIGLLERILREQAENTVVSADDVRSARLALVENYRTQTGPAAEGGRAKAERLWRTIVSTQQQISGPDDLEVLRLRNKFAVFYATTGQNQKALPLYRMTLEARERILGSEDQETLLSRSNLAICQEALGDRKAAARLFGPLYEQRARLLGPDHADTLDSLDRYALCLYNLRRYAEAERHFVLLVEARTRIGGQDDTTRANYLSWLGWSRYRAGRGYPAAQTLRECLKARERILGRDHADTMSARHAVGDVLQALHRYKEAIPVLEEALADRARVLGAGHADTVKTRSLLARTLIAVERHDEAVELRRDDYTALERAHGARDRETILALTHLADAHEEAKNYPAALAAYSSALGTAEAVLGPEHADTVACRFSVASYLQSMGSPDEAIPLFEQVLENRRRNHGADDERTLRIRHNIAQCHDAAGRTQPALTQYRELLADVERALPARAQLRRNLTADLASPPVDAWWHRELLTGRRLWQVALGVPPLAEAADAGYRLDVLYERRWLAPAASIATLRRTWSVESRDSLLETLHGLARPDRPVLAWNIARYVSCVRDGVAAGYLDEPTAWDLLDEITDPTARAYGSWAAFTADYLAGREDWLDLSGPPQPSWPTAHRRKIEALDRLLDAGNEDSPFHRAPWDTIRSAPAPIRLPLPDPLPDQGPDPLPDQGPDPLPDPREPAAAEQTTMTGTTTVQMPAAIPTAAGTAEVH